jgi:hypothetical protein
MQVSWEPQHRQRTKHLTSKEASAIFPDLCGPQVGMGIASSTAYLLSLYQSQPHTLSSLTPTAPQSLRMVRMLPGGTSPLLVQLVPQEATGEGEGLQPKEGEEDAQGKSKGKRRRLATQPSAELKFVLKRSGKRTLDPMHSVAGLPSGGRQRAAGRPVPCQGGRGRGSGACFRCSCCWLTNCH